MDCQNLDTEFIECFRNGHYDQDVCYICKRTHEECTLYYDDYCQVGEE